MEKSINYGARDFDNIKSELISFSNKYYPEISKTFNDNSVGAWFIDLISAVGDDLNYYIDRCYQENNINSANLLSSMLSMARNNNVKIPGPKASICEIQLSCTLPISSTQIMEPDWIYAPVVKMGSIVGNTTYQFELSEDVNFAEQFNSDGISNRTFEPKKNSNGVMTGYTVTKTTIANGGTSKIYKKVINDTDLEPFMEIILPEKNIMSVESIIFKESSNFKYNPNTYEFYVDDEEFMVQNESVSTYRYFEVDSLSDQYRFGTKTKYAEGSDGNNYVIDEYNNKVYEDYTETADGIQRTSRYFRGEWKPITQKYIVERTDNDYTKIIFGNATSVQEPPESATTYGTYIASKVLNNTMLGMLPKAGWTMYVLYKTGGGESSNVGQGSITSIINMNTEFTAVNATDSKIKNTIIKSISVNNISPSVGGKDAPSAEEVKYITKYSVSNQNRCVTLKDYKAKILSIPPKYGCPYRCNAIEENNKVVISTLGANAKGKLDSSLPQVLADNLVEYLSHYKQITDYVAIRSGKIYNLAFEADVFIDKNYTTADVIASIITVIEDYMDIDNHDMGEDIFIGDLEKEINNVDGVVSLIELRVYNIWGGSYSKDKSPLPKYIEYSDSCTTIETDYAKVPDGASSFRIGLKETDNVLYSDYDSMFEILEPTNDICIRAKLK